MGMLWRQVGHPGWGHNWEKAKGHLEGDQTGGRTGVLGWGETTGRRLRGT